MEMLGSFFVAGPAVGHDPRAPPLVDQLHGQPTLELQVFTDWMVKDIFQLGQEDRLDPPGTADGAHLPGGFIHGRSATSVEVASSSWKTTPPAEVPVLNSSIVSCGHMFTFCQKVQRRIQVIFLNSSS